ncbi:MAG TPA: aldo/keto reductase [Solirubrobacterales bacterium]|nr:aldo/keto reductase [Solirubrobacterales bacterium]
MMNAPEAPVLTLHDGVGMPQLGFGTWQIPAEETQQRVEEALAVGYRHVDTAAVYGNEEGVGAAVAATGVRREDVFVTTKLWNSSQGYDRALRAFDKSLERLGSGYVDLYLIHWPLPSKDLFLDTWRAFERIKEEGGARSIGVSNFRIEDLERLEQEAEQLPTVNQIELHPRLQQPDLRAWHADHQIATEAWSPLAQGDLLRDGTIETVAAHHHRSPAQVILRWHLQIGNVVIPKSSNPERIRQNFEVFDFELSEDDMAAIERLDADERTGGDPSTFSLA